MARDTPPPKVEMPPDDAPHGRPRTARFRQLPAARSDRPTRSAHRPHAAGSNRVTDLYTGSSAPSIG